VFFSLDFFEYEVFYSRYIDLYNAVSVAVIGCVLSLKPDGSSSLDNIPGHETSYLGQNLVRSLP
jgi:hypothetical protein